MSDAFGEWRRQLVHTRRISVATMPSPEGMFAIQLSTPVPGYPIGKDIATQGIAEDGGFYFCKDDTRQSLVRASEVIFTKLAEDLGLPTIDFRVIQDVSGRTYFGSFRHPSTADQEKVRGFFLHPARNEVGGPDSYKATFIARVFAYDMFIGNPDRIVANFVTINEGAFERIAPIDFADSSLLRDPYAVLPSANSNTRRWQRTLEHTHGFPHEAVEEMLTRIAAIPVGFLDRVFERLPEGWIDPEQQGDFREFWLGNARQDRLAAIGAALNDGAFC